VIRQLQLALIVLQVVFLMSLDLLIAPYVQLAHSRINPEQVFVILALQVDMVNPMVKCCAILVLKDLTQLQIQPFVTFVRRLIFEMSVESALYVQKDIAPMVQIQRAVSFALLDEVFQMRPSALIVPLGDFLTQMQVHLVSLVEPVHTTETGS
jgi:hypothetical protein